MKNSKPYEAGMTCDSCDDSLNGANDGWQCEDNLCCKFCHIYLINFRFIFFRETALNIKLTNVGTFIFQLNARLKIPQVVVSSQSTSNKNIFKNKIKYLSVAMILVLFDQLSKFVRVILC